MVPKYKGFDKDLRNFVDSVNALWSQMLTDVDQNSLKGEAKDAYDFMNRKFEQIVASVQMCLGEHKLVPNADKNLAWGDLLEHLEDVCPAMFKNDPSLSSEQNAAAMTVRLDNNNNFAVYNASRKLNDLKLSISGMIAKGEYSEYKSQIAGLAKKRQAYFDELDTYQLGDDYDDTYEVLLEKHHAAAVELEDKKAYYDSHHKNVRELEKEYYKTMREASLATGDDDTRIVGLQAEISRDSEKLAKIQEQIAVLESLRGVDTYNAIQIKEKIDESRGAIREAEERAFRLVQEISDVSDRHREKNKEYRSYDAKLRVIEFPQNNPRYEKLPEEAKVMQNVTAQYAHLLRVRLNLSRFREQYVRKLAALGVSPDKPEELMERFRLGSALANQMAKEGGKGIVTGAVADGIKNYTVPYQIYTTLKEFTDQLKKVYNASPKMQQEMDEKIHTPLDLLHLVDKAVGDCRSKSDAMYMGRDDAGEFADLKKYKLSLGDFRSYFDQAAAAFARLEVSAGECDDLSAVIEGKSQEKAAIGEEIEQQKEHIKGLEEGLKSESAEAKIESLRKEEAGIVMGLSKKGDEVALLSDKVRPHKEKVKTLEDALNTMKSKTFTVEDEYTRAQHKFDSLDRKKTRFMKTRDMHDALAKKYTAFSDKLGVGPACEITEDIWAERRGHILDQAKEFFRVADFGKSSGHTNTDEFNRMIGSVKNVYLGQVGPFSLEDPEAIGRNQTPAEIKEKLDAMKAAVENYIHEKTKRPHPITFRQRAIRMDYANRLLRFADTASRQLDDFVKMQENLEKDIAETRLPDIDTFADSGSTRYDINQTIKDLRSGRRPERPDLKGFLERKNAENDPLLEAVEAKAAAAPEVPGAPLV